MKYLRFPLFLLLINTSHGQSGMPAVESLDSGWNSIATDGVCSAGTPYQFHVKAAQDSAGLLLFFNGGGACWFGQACDLNSQPNIHTPFAELDDNNPTLSGGIFDLENPENPFADFDMLFIPYCTGDVFIGAGPKRYTYENSAGESVEVTAYHQGYANSMTILDWVYRNFPAPERVVISGSSAGAIGASFYAGLVAEHYAEVPIVLLADGAGGYGSPNLHRTFSAWNTAAVLPAWPEYAGQSNTSLTFEDFYIASARHNANLTIAQYNTAEDAVQKSFTLVLGDPPDSYTLPQRILNNYLQIESAVDKFYTYTAGGSVHTILRLPLFYQYEVEGVRFVDWVGALINGAEVADVSCVEEAQGCSIAPGEGG